MLMMNTGIRNLGNFSAFCPCNCNKKEKNVSYCVALICCDNDTSNENPKALKLKILCNSCFASKEVDLSEYNYHKKDLLGFS